MSSKDAKVSVVPWKQATVDSLRQYGQALIQLADMVERNEVTRSDIERGAYISHVSVRLNDLRMNAIMALMTGEGWEEKPAPASDTQAA